MEKCNCYFLSVKYNHDYRIEYLLSRTVSLLLTVSSMSLPITSIASLDSEIASVAFVSATAIIRI